MSPGLQKQSSQHLHITLSSRSQRSENTPTLSSTSGALPAPAPVLLSRFLLNLHTLPTFQAGVGDKRKEPQNPGGAFRDHYWDDDAKWTGGGGEGSWPPLKGRALPGTDLLFLGPSCPSISQTLSLGRKVLQKVLPEAQCLPPPWQGEEAMSYSCRQRK